MIFHLNSHKVTQRCVAFLYSHSDYVAVSHIIKEQKPNPSTYCACTVFNLTRYISTYLAKKNYEPKNMQISTIIVATYTF